MTTCASVEDILKQTWGYDRLRPLQQEVVDAALAGKDALVVMPTGSGKSLCFQIPPLVDGSLTVVISPLISLMADQVHSLRVVGYPAAAINSSMDPAEIREVESQLLSGELKLLYVSPERMAMDSFRALLKQAHDGAGVGRFAIDEAHCISEWGHDFRPEYRILSSIRRDFPKAPIHALTATATIQVREDILRQLELREAEVFVGSFDRPNLAFRVVPRVNVPTQVAEVVRQYPEDAAIVYCLSRKDTESVATALNHLGIKASAYHAGMETSERTRISKEFAQEKINVVVATVAFGMGIDRSNVRAVIHACLPKSIEAYQQETGRAGRDGLHSECVLLYGAGDVARIERFFDGGDPQHVAVQRKNLQEVRAFATTVDCRHKLLVEYFGQEYEGPVPCGACDVCLDGTQDAPDSTKNAHRILATVRELNQRHNDFGFGANHITAILVGAHVKAIAKHGHDQLRGYGCMRAFARERITAWIHQLEDQKLLRQSGGMRSFLMISDLGVQALAERKEIKLRDPRSVSLELAPDEFEGVDNGLLSQLRDFRRKLAEERGVPAFVLFDDKTLRHLASMRPSSRVFLMSVPGMGEKRATDFGDQITELIRAYAKEKGVEMNQPEVSSRARAPRKPKATNSLMRLTPLFAQGLSIEECAHQAGLAVSTTGGYLADYVALERPASVAAWVDDATYARVEAAVKEHGTERLKPIFDALNGEVAYDKIRIVMIHLSYG